MSYNNHMKPILLTVAAAIVLGVFLPMPFAVVVGGLAGAYFATTTARN
jgi:hypothetical protein